MQESNMTEQDWDTHLSQWGASFGESPAEVTEREPTYKPSPEKGFQCIPIVRVERKSAKAIFFVTEDSMSGIYGFWCPKGIIEEQSTTHITVPDWFETKVIEFY